MSFDAMAWAIEQTVTRSPTQKLVLLALSDCMNRETGRCDPSIQRLAETCHISYRTVTRVLSDLEKLNLIARSNRGNNGFKISNSYFIKMGHGDLTIGHSDLTDRTNTTPKIGHSDLTDRTQCPINQEVTRNKKPGKKQEGASVVFPEELRGLSNVGRVQRR